MHQFHSTLITSVDSCAVACREPRTPFLVCRIRGCVAGSKTGFQRVSRELRSRMAEAKFEPGALSQRDGRTPSRLQHRVKSERNNMMAHRLQPNTNPRDVRKSCYGRRQSSSTVLLPPTPPLPERRRSLGQEEVWEVRPSGFATRSALNASLERGRSVKSICPAVCHRCSFSCH